MVGVFNFLYRNEGGTFTVLSKGGDGAISYPCCGDFFAWPSLVSNDLHQSKSLWTCLTTFFLCLFLLLLLFMLFLCCGFGCFLFSALFLALGAISSPSSDSAA